METKGVGSIWNKNSWHWEEKNYTVFGKEYIKEKLLEISIEPTEPANSIIKILEVKKLDGQASISIRKAKQIVYYEWTMELEIKAEEHEGSGEEEHTGTVTIGEFLSEDEDLNLETKFEKPNLYTEKVRRVVDKDFRAKIMDILTGLKEKLIEHDCDERKIAADDAQRQEELDNMNKAAASMGEKKQ